MHLDDADVPEVGELWLFNGIDDNKDYMITTIVRIDEEVIPYPSSAPTESWFIEELEHHNHRVTIADRHELLCPIAGPVTR